MDRSLFSSLYMNRRMREDIARAFSSEEPKVDGIESSSENEPWNGDAAGCKKSACRGLQVFA
jgi:hypothetical protein